MTDEWSALGQLQKLKDEPCQLGLCGPCEGDKERRRCVPCFARFWLDSGGPTPDDLRELGWSVAVHNDYYVDGMRYTFWLMTKDGVAVKGEGRTDDDALTQIRLKVALTQIRLKVATRAQETPSEEKAAIWREVINKALWRQLKTLCGAIDTALVTQDLPGNIKSAVNKAHLLLHNTETDDRARDEAARQNQEALREEG